MPRSVVKPPQGRLRRTLCLGLKRQWVGRPFQAENVQTPDAGEDARAHFLSVGDHASYECGHKCALQLLPDADYQSIGLSCLSNTICADGDLHVAFWHIIPGHLFNVVDSVEARRIGGHVAMLFRTVRSSED